MLGLDQTCKGQVPPGLTAAVVHACSTAEWSVFHWFSHTVWYPGPVCTECLHHGIGCDSV